MTPHHVLLKFHLSHLGSLSGLLKLIQGHITLHTKGTPRPLKVMCLEHLDHALIHRPQQRRGVRRQEDELDVLMHVLQHVGVGGSIIQDHQDTEGEALRRAILLQLVHQGIFAVHLKNVTCYPTIGIGEPMDKYASLIVPLECMRVLGLVDQDRLDLAVSHRVSLQQESETVLKCLEAWGRILLPRDVRAVRHFLSLQAHSLETCWGLYPPPR